MKTKSLRIKRASDAGEDEVPEYVKNSSLHEVNPPNIDEILIMPAGLQFDDDIEDDYTDDEDLYDDVSVDIQGDDDDNDDNFEEQSESGSETENEEDEEDTSDDDEQSEEVEEEHEDGSDNEEIPSGVALDNIREDIDKDRTKTSKSKRKVTYGKNVVGWNDGPAEGRSIIDNTKMATTTEAPKKQKSKPKSNESAGQRAAAQKPDEYEYDTSDEEDIRNTVGNVPMEWYKEYPHLGYDWDGQQILKPKATDELDNFLKKIEDPEFWRTVKDPQTGQDVVLTDEDIQLIKRIKAQQIPDVSFDEYAPWIDWFTSEALKTPIRKFPEHKRSFTPSRIEARKVSKIVHGLKMGWIKTREETAKLREKKEPQFYMLWETDDQAEEMRRIHKHIPAPKRPLPGHAESYNPPAEYLFDDKEMRQWLRLKDTPAKRKLHFVPQKYKSLREVPAYERYTRERFLRCLDLYLCPRAIKMRLNIEPESLVPKLPSPKDLQPFPTALSVEYVGHSGMVRSISCDTKGQYLVSGSDDHTLKIWEVNTGRCLRTVQLDAVVHRVSWCPNPALSLVAVACGQTVHLINPLVGDHLVVTKTDSILSEAPPQDIIVPERISSTVRWEQAAQDACHKHGIRISLQHYKPVSQVSWHGRGDYFATVMPDGLNRSVLINQLSRRRSQLPFTKSKGLVQCVLFHPVRPFLFVATQRHIRIYDLVKQELLKKLMSNSKWISSMAIHPGGDNLLVGTYDRKMLWFDLDLSTKPYQTLRLHGTAVRSVAYHKRYPLFASGSDDRTVIVSHGMVYNDLLQNPLIVPLKKLCEHEKRDDFGVFDVLFHPTQPWLFSAGADATIKLYS